MEETRESKQKISIKKSEAVLIQAAETKDFDQDYFLTNLDLNFPCMYHVIYHFRSNGDKNSNKNVANKLKEALGKVLTHYYPLAGTLMIDGNGKYVVKCTNKGVWFVEAEADCDIDVLDESRDVPDNALLRKLIHTQETSILNLPLLSIQITRFRCGGFVLGMTMNHMMTDGTSGQNFVNSWAETARGVPITTLPYLDRRVLEPRKPPLIKYVHDEYMKTEDISGIADYYQSEKNVTEVVRFDKETVNTLKRNTMQDGGNLQSCTSFTVITAFIWKSRCKALKMKSDQIAKLFIAVDGRSKPDYSLPKAYFGVTITQICCSCLAGELMEKPLSFAVQVIQNRLKKVNWEYFKSVNDHIEVNQENARISPAATAFVNSWTRIPFHTTDFGWGTPYKTSSVNSTMKEYILFLPNPDGNEFSVRLCLPETAMKTIKTLLQL